MAPNGLKQLILLYVAKLSRKTHSLKKEAVEISDIYIYIYILYIIVIIIIIIIIIIFIFIILLIHRVLQ